MMLFLVTCWCCLPVNYLVSSLNNWFSQEKMIFCICLSILIKIETNIVFNKCLHYLVRASLDSGLFGRPTIFLFHEWQNSMYSADSINQWLRFMPVITAFRYQARYVSQIRVNTHANAVISNMQIQLNSSHTLTWVLFHYQKLPTARHLQNPYLKETIIILFESLRKAIQLS